MNDREQKEETQGGGMRETLIALLICAIVLLLPVFVIEHEYKLFTKEHGVAKEGAAGAGLWLAVMFRTVSRTVLRTIIRASARAGMRASLRGAIRTSVRTIGRTQSKRLADQNIPDHDIDNQRKNIHSLFIASALLYSSWVIVISLGQPFSTLLHQESEELVLAQEEQDHKNRILELQELAITAFQREQDWKAIRQEIRTLEQDIKKERNLEVRQELEKRQNFLRQKELLDERAYQEAFLKSKKVTLDPATLEQISEEEEEKEVQRVSWLQTLAPYPAEPKSGTTFTVEIRGVESEGTVLDPFSFSVEIDKPILQKSINEKSIVVADGAFGINKISPDPNLVNWVQLRSGLTFHFSKKIDAVGEVIVKSDDVMVEHVSLGVDQILVTFGGKTPWDSSVIWLGGFVVVLPLWFIYLCQSFVARRENLVLKHETGPIGGGIQLYFAGAFSFMPLTSDIEVPDATVMQRARIAMYGLWPPALLALLIWVLWTQIKDPRLLFLSDAILIFPMVQCFPLSPLEGIYVWKHSKFTWFVTFLFIMSLFMIVASAGLKGVI